MGSLAALQGKRAGLVLFYWPTLSTIAPPTPPPSGLGVQVHPYKEIKLTQRVLFCFRNC